ncbi:MAG: iron ABC transporter permease [Spirochaetaceae bacterium]|nr:MAG: iron ABC transporter permease [Spirochaetaceae bacterium]
MGRRHALIALAFLALLVPPVVAVLGAGALERGLLQWVEDLLQVFSRGATWRSARFSLVQAAVSAILSVALALPGAYYLANLRFPGRRMAESLTLLPFVMPSLIVILAVISFYGRAGVLNQLLGTDLRLVYSAAGIILAHVIFNYAVALRIIAGGWRQIDTRLREVSLSLGESGGSRLLHLHAPLILPSILTALAIVFLYCFVSFGVVLVFGGVQFATLEVRIYQEMFTSLNLSGAGALALLQLAMCGAVVILIQLISETHRRESVAGRRTTVRHWASVRPRVRLACTAYWAVVGLFLFAPLGSIVLRAFRPGAGWSLRAFQALWTGRIGDREVYEIIRASFTEILLTSLGVALLAAVLTVSAALAAARALRGRTVPWLDTIMRMPLAVSSVTFSLGMRLLWLGRFPALTLILLTQAVMAFPLVFGSVRQTVDALPRRYLEAARSLGAPPLFRIRTVELPVLRRGLVNAFTFAFALSLADFTAILTIGRGEVVTFPVAMYRLIGFQSFDVALALGVWYIALVALAFIVIDSTATGYGRRSS